MNSCNFVGTVSCDVESGETVNHEPLARFSLNTNGSGYNIQMVAFGHIAQDIVSKYLKMGDLVAITSHASAFTRKNDPKTVVTRFIIDSITIINTVEPVSGISVPSNDELYDELPE